VAALASGSGGSGRRDRAGEALVTASLVIRVLLADDQRVVREGLGTLLALLPDIELVGTAADGEEALALVAEHDPDIVLMDLRMPRLDGIEATRRLGERGGRPAVIALTTYADDASVLGALRAGARGYLTKDAGAEEIRAAVVAVAGGQVALDPAAQRQVVAALSEPAAAPPPPPAPELPDELTPREAEVLALIAEGLTNSEIAERLVVTAATVKSHVNHIFAKIGARDRAQAVVYAYAHGIAQAA
jgi:DNA-binding NarL/FixJ family response regulator